MQQRWKKLNVTKEHSFHYTKTINDTEKEKGRLNNENERLSVLQQVIQQ